MKAPAVAVRDARRDEALGIARIRVAGWRVAYAGVFEDAVLEAMDPEADVPRSLPGLRGSSQHP